MKDLLMLFLIAGLGYLLGTISFRGIRFGPAGILFVALLFGHYGVKIPAIVQSIGIVLFIAPVGLMAGPTFFGHFKKKFLAFMTIGIGCIVLGSIVTVLIGKLFNIPAPLVVGMFTGALTSFPALATALEVTGGDAMVTIGHGIAAPFGVVGVVLFVQLLPRILGTNVEEEIKKLAAQNEAASTKEINKEIKPAKPLDPMGMTVFCGTLVLGLLISMLKIPLPGGMEISFGSSGGPLIAGIIIGHFHRIGNISIRVPANTLKAVRELGFMFFLLGAGVTAGAGFVKVLVEYGWQLILYGAIMTLAPMIVFAFVGIKLFKLETLSTLGGITGGMTATPALGALISAFGTEDVGVSYAAAYPFALISIVFATQFMLLMW